LIPLDDCWIPKNYCQFPLDDIIANNPLKTAKNYTKNRLRTISQLSINTKKSKKNKKKLKNTQKAVKTY
jgi:hypothetical protein